jgi:hypothetical protein
MSPGVELLRAAMGIWFFIRKPVNAEIVVKAGGLDLWVGQVVEVREGEATEVILNQYPQ